MQNKLVTLESLANSRALRRKASARYAQDKAAECIRVDQLLTQQGDSVGAFAAYIQHLSWLQIAESYGAHV